MEFSEELMRSFDEELNKIRIKSKPEASKTEETVLELLNHLAARKILKTTPEEGDEGFEGPPCRQSLEEDDASNALKDVKSLSKEVGEDDVETLSNLSLIHI